MALDPSIFFQGAALRQANDARAQAHISGLFDKLQARKDKEDALEQARATDYEGSAYRVLMAQEQGVAPDPSDLLRAKAWDKLQTTKIAIDPLTKVPYRPQSSIFDGFKAAPLEMPMDQSQLDAPYPAMANVPLPPRGGSVDFDRIAQAKIDNAARVNMPAGDMVMPPDATGIRGLDYEGVQNAQKMNMEIQKKRIEQKTEPMNESQGKVATFADRLIQSESDLGSDQAEAAQLNLKQRGMGEIPVAGNFMISSNYRKARQAERNFINAVLRRESGAVISPEEFKNAKLQYFPQPGDDPETLAQKKQNRADVINGFVREAGPAYTPKKSDKSKQVEYQSTPSGNKYRVVE